MKDRHVHVSVSLLLVIFLHCLSSIRCQTSANAKALRQKLFITDGYDKRVRPSLDQTLVTGKSFFCPVYIRF